MSFQRDNAAFEAMGFDIGAIHAATPGAATDIAADLAKPRRKDWLYRAAKTAAAAVEEDFAEWRRVSRRARASSRASTAASARGDASTERRP
jgi:hypothetical protein